MGSDETRDANLQALAREQRDANEARRNDLVMIPRRDAEYLHRLTEALVPTEAEQARRAEMARPPKCDNCGAVECLRENVDCPGSWSCRYCQDEPAKEFSVDEACLKLQAAGYGSAVGYGPPPDPPTDLDAVEAALGPEPSTVEGKVLREGWFEEGWGFISDPCPHSVYVKLVEVSPPEEVQPIDPADQAAAEHFEKFMGGTEEA